MSKKHVITLTSQIQRRSNIVTQYVEDDVLMLDTEQGKFFAAPAGATVIWRLIEAPAQVSDLRDALLAEYDIDRETCERELLAFLTQLHNQRLIEIV